MRRRKGETKIEKLSPYEQQYFLLNLGSCRKAACKLLHEMEVAGVRGTLYTYTWIHSMHKNFDTEIQGCFQHSNWTHSVRLKYMNKSRENLREGGGGGNKLDSWPIKDSKLWVSFNLLCKKSVTWIKVWIFYLC